MISGLIIKVHFDCAYVASLKGHRASSTADARTAVDRVTEKYLAATGARLADGPTIFRAIDCNHEEWVVFVGPREGAP